MSTLVADTLTLQVAGVTLHLLNGNDLQVSFDEGNSPFTTLSASITRPAANIMALLDPAQKQPLTLYVAYNKAGAFTLTGLYVYERSFDPSSDIVSLMLVTEEMLLQSYTPQSTISLIGQQSSVKSIVETVLPYPLGGSRTTQLVSGAVDKSFRVFSEAHNRFPNPDIANTTGLQGTTNNTISRVQATGTQAGYGYAVRSTASAVVSRIDVQYVQTAPVAVAASANVTYTLSMAVRASASNSVTLFMQFNNSQGATIQTVSKSLGTVPTTFGSRYFVTAVAPPNTSSMTWVLRDSATNRPSGSTLDAAQIAVTDSDNSDPTAVAGNTLPYFSGATADTADYHYFWSGDANASESNRTPIVQRDPTNLLWTPGTSAYDFLKPILDASGLRLFLREDGVWALANNGYVVSGQVNVQTGVNLYAATESTSLGDRDADDLPLNADAVFIEYAWMDVLGIARTAVDSAVTTGYTRPYRQQLDQPYPGPGQASFLLARLLARKSTVTIQARIAKTTRPGMSGLISLPNRPAYTGYINRVDLDFSRASMTIATKGLITLLANSIGKAPTTQTIGSVSGNIGAYTN